MSSFFFEPVSFFVTFDNTEIIDFQNMTLGESLCFVLFCFFNRNRSRKVGVREL